jgi:hypothetical protein
MSRIAEGAPFPELGGLDLEDNPVNFADLTAGSWGVVLFYRGHW